MALCDNKYQGIVPVPEKIGNGDDADDNLYWGGIYGMRSYFNKSADWTLIKKYKIDTVILERLIYKHISKPYYLIADAYRGREIKQCTIDFFKSCAGRAKDTISVNNNTIALKGNSTMIAYIGHDGLMDFSLPEYIINADKQQRDAIILACASKDFFGPYLHYTKAKPVLWTTGLMCPEAYSLHAALNAYVNKMPMDSIQNSAATAYAKYQRCDVKFASRLLVSGY